MSNFKELGVQEKFIRGLKELNIIVPSEIQVAAIPVLLKEKGDFIAQAPTGTGKTAAFGIPLLQKIDPKKNVIQGIVLSPTRELGQQIAKQIFKFTKYSDKIFVEGLFGGFPIEKQIQNLKRPTHIVVATPGRLIDLLKREALSLENVKLLILDEADEMLSMGFKDDLDKILATMKKEDKWLFSATMPQGILQIIKKHMSPDAHKIDMSVKDGMNKDIQHQFIRVEDKDKLPTLLEFLKSQGAARGVLFCRTKVASQKLADSLQEKKISAAAIHGDLNQKERDKVMRAFKNKKLQILIATDLAARGIDIENLAYVVHYQLPDKEEYYTHRSGRTARGGKKGFSLCFVGGDEQKQLYAYEKNLGISFKEIK